MQLTLRLIFIVAIVVTVTDVVEYLPPQEAPGTPHPPLFDQRHLYNHLAGRGQFPVLAFPGMDLAGPHSPTPPFI
jgi:hypothetical protein